MTNKDLKKLETIINDCPSQQESKHLTRELIEDFKFLKSKVGLQTFNLMLESCSSCEEKCRLYKVFGIDPSQYFNNDWSK